MNDFAATGGPSRVSADAASALGCSERVAAICSRVLGEIVASVILHGSLVLGDYTPGQSDTDLLVIVDRALAHAEMDELVSALLAEQADAPGRVDLRVVRGDVAATPPEQPPMDLYVRLDPGRQPEIVTRHRGEPDLLVELSLCRACGRALVGAGPRELIGEVPDQWLLRLGDAQLARWQALTHDTRHAALMVLTTCRIWRFSETRSHCSKSEAGRWALTCDPSLQAVRGALRQRTGDPMPIQPADIGRLLTIARAQVAATEVD
jgi:predicted nucleotidyltransferase